MATMVQNLDTARILSQQKREKLKSSMDQIQTAEPATLNRARQLPHSPKNEGTFKRLLRKKGVKKDTAKKLPIPNPLHLITARGLQISWIAINPLTAAASIGITTILGLIYLNFHLMMRAILPKFFAPFGTEWGASRTKSLRPISKILGGSEIAVLLLLDVLIIVAVALIVAIIVGVNTWIENNGIYTWIGAKLLPLLGIPFF